MQVMSDLGGACSGEQDKSLNEMLQSVTDALRRCHSEVYFYFGLLLREPKV